MTDVYRLEENIVCCFQNSAFYIGFENESEKQLKKESFTIYDNIINPGDKITGFDSGKERTSYMLNYGHMTFEGFFMDHILFEIFEPKQKSQQNDLFNVRPRWFLSFFLIGPNKGLYLASSPGCFYDIHPRKINRL